MKSKAITLALSGMIALLFIAWLGMFFALFTGERTPPNVVHEYTQYQEWEDGSFKGTTTQGTEIVGCKQTGICWRNDGVDLE